MYTELLIGAGSRHEKRLAYDQAHVSWSSLTTLDINQDHNPDVVWDLEKFPYPFPDDNFDEIHAYEVMEHLGRQGDWRFFFKQWNELWRILKPNGLFFGTSPDYRSKWAWGDPGHTRVLQPETMVFLSQMQYQVQVGQTPMTDYRFVYHGDFEPEMLGETPDQTIFPYVLRAIKPSRSES